MAVRTVGVSQSDGCPLQWKEGPTRRCHLNLRPYVRQILGRKSGDITVRFTVG